MPIKRKQIILSLELDLFTEFRKTIFREGVAPHEFFAFIAERVSLRDPDIDVIIKKLKQRKEGEKKTGFKKFQKFDADALYQQIENSLKKNE